ncbi:UNVERIFIED_CONTAM: hypothetical protein GTU68_008578 [Idotea baltica]|nr:hypothetical protein [Idotea baltica]
MELQPRLAAGELALKIVGARSCFDGAVQAVGAPSNWIEKTPGLSFHEAGRPAIPVKPGQVSADAGRLAHLAICEAVTLCLDGQADAIVTAPISKEALNLAGAPFSGHTELLAHLTGARDSVMLLAHGDFRVSHISTHVALSEAGKCLTPERLTRVVELTDAAMRDLGIAAPRLAVAALNPHAGEGGLFGREDIEVTTPLVAALCAQGYDVTGPVPGDTVFVKLRAKQFDAVIATYHDQGHIPVKLLGFSSGVNVTLGLPVVRSSVDHGTAFDIAGKGTADANSLMEACDLAITLATARVARKATKPSRGTG